MKRDDRLSIRKKVSASLFFLLLSLSVILSGCSFINTDSADTSDIIVARINNIEVKKDYFDEIFNIFKIQQEEINGPEIWKHEVNGRKYIDFAKETVLDYIINETILLENAADLGVTASEEQVDQEIKQIKKDFESERRKNELIETIVKYVK